MAACPLKGVFLMYELISLIIAPVVVGLVIELIYRWLDEEDDN